jgi:glutathione S-transferase
MPKITLHYTVIPASRAERIFWLLEELGVEYDVKAYVRDGFVASGLKAVSGLGKVSESWGKQLLACHHANCRRRY